MSVQGKLVNTLLILSPIFISLTSADVKRRELDPIRGTYKAWWVIAKTPIDIVQKMIDESDLNGKIILVTPDWSFWRDNVTHPLVYELGHEFDCGPIKPSWLRSDFNEFKFEIPFVASTTRTQKLLNFKYILYEDSVVESTSSRLFYGLDARKGQFNTNNGTYNITYSGKSLSALVTSHGNWTRANTYPKFKIFEDLMGLPWFGIRGTGSCARHNYDFDNAIVKPITGSISADVGMLGSVYSTPLMPFFGLGDEIPFGSVEINVNFTMSLPKDCASI